MTIYLSSISDCAQHIVEVTGGDMVVGTPLGIGKPNPLINALWERAKCDGSIRLEICTALSLQLPRGHSLLEKRFLTPFSERIFGRYPELNYLDDVANDSLAENLKLTEFYIQSGKMLHSKHAQRNYTSSNYTHAARDILDRGMNVLVQMVAVKKTPRGNQYSLSSNTDLTLDMVSIIKRKGLKKPLFVAMVNPEMPFMAGQAVVSDDFFDVIVDDRAHYFKPFATPRAKVNAVDYHIGLLASTLIQDGGTLQVGIGSLGDALIYTTQLRHQKNPKYQLLLSDSGLLDQHHEVIARVGGTGIFRQGLYAASEMFVEGFAHLYDAGILRRKVYPDAAIQTLINKGVLTSHVPNNVIEILLEYEILDERLTKRQMKRLQALGILQADLKMAEGQLMKVDGQCFTTDLFDYDNVQAIQQHCLGRELKQGAVLHGAFFLGSPWFYHWLHHMDDETAELFQMTAVSQVNELYGGEALDRVQRVKARFINTCMKVDVLGAAASDTLDNQQVVSGVGGQYNFVAMAHALEDSRSILMLRSTHQGAHGVESNVVWKYPYCTIPRHLRDIVITEYGIADLRGQSDETCIKRMICIADSRFQEHLRRQAVRFGKLSSSWSVPEVFRQNQPELIHQQHVQWQEKGCCPAYPFGSDFTDIELELIAALQYLKKRTGSQWQKLKILFKAWCLKAEKNWSEHLKRMDLLLPKNKQEKFYQSLLIFALEQTHSTD